MADNDRPSEMNLATVENEEPTTIHQPPSNAALDVHEPDVRVGWTPSESQAQAAGNETAVATKLQPSARPPRVERRREPRTPRPHLFVTIAHWAMVILLGLSFVTGVRLTWGYIDSPFRSWSMPLKSIGDRLTT